MQEAHHQNIPRKSVVIEPGQVTAHSPRNKNKLTQQPPAHHSSLGCSEEWSDSLLYDHELKERSPLLLMESLFLCQAGPGPGSGECLSLLHKSSEAAGTPRNVSRNLPSHWNAVAWPSSDTNGLCYPAGVHSVGTSGLGRSSGLAWPKREDIRACCPVRTGAPDPQVPLVHTRDAPQRWSNCSTGFDGVISCCLGPGLYQSSPHRGQFSGSLSFCSQSPVQCVHKTTKPLHLTGA